MKVEKAVSVCGVLFLGKNTNNRYKQRLLAGRSQFREIVASWIGWSWPVVAVVRGSRTRRVIVSVCILFVFDGRHKVKQSAIVCLAERRGTVQKGKLCLRC